MPNMAEIPLPPGMSLDQFQDLQAHLSKYPASSEGPIINVDRIDSSQDRYYYLSCLWHNCVGLVSDYFNAK